MSPQPFSPAELALLARGAVRLDGAIPPVLTDVPEAIGASDKAAASLTKRKLGEWIEVVDASLGWKRKSDKPIGLIITDLGRAALEAIETEIADAGPPTSKIGHVLETLRAPEGISLAEMMAATGWQAHSARAALTGLRKKGFVITRTTGASGQATRYHIAGGAQ